MCALLPQFFVATKQSQMQAADGHLAIHDGVDIPIRRGDPASPSDERSPLSWTMLQT